MCEELITLLGVAKVDPNCADPDFGSALYSLLGATCVAELVTAAWSSLRHLLATFHPAAVGVTCSIPIDLTRTTMPHNLPSLVPHTVFQSIITINSIHGKPTLDGHTFTQCIRDVNTDWRQRQIDTCHTFTLATHPRIARDSAAYRVFRSSCLYDAHVMQHIWLYFYIAAMLPTCEADVAFGACTYCGHVFRHQLIWFCHDARHVLRVLALHL